ncbi:MAG: hypothetical protein MUF15_16555 [Acidobacteria bacterium]|jgi:hypothetical protein|nr:hypothetical protein [Acidobacteriota bacterium]
MLSLKGVYNHGQIKLDQTIESDREIPVIITFLDDFEEGNPQKYRFADLVGKLEWNGDPVAEQRSIRNEW